MNRSFKEEIYKLVAEVPYGKVTTYGDLAALAGHPYAARVVGQIAHFGPEGLPWHRVVNRMGGLALGFWGGKSAHAQLLEAEGIQIKDFKIVDFEEVRWRYQSNLL
ncbi:MAG TPA: methylated-DNA--[protein]-cysteine S-methyltransferase [Candidatus Saccharimonadales bacterium]